MDKSLLESLEIIDVSIQRAVTKKEVSGSPFVDFTNDATAIFAGFRVVAELLQIDLCREGIDDEAERLLSHRQKNALCDMIRATSWVMERRACDISSWAHDRMKETGDDD